MVTTTEFYGFPYTNKGGNPTKCSITDIPSIVQPVGTAFLAFLQSPKTHINSARTQYTMAVGAVSRRQRATEVCKRLEGR